MENGDITYSEYKFLLNLCDGLDDVGQVGEDLSVLLVFGCGLGQVWEVENRMTQIFIHVFLQKVMNNLI